MFDWLVEVNKPSIHFSNETDDVNIERFTSEVSLSNISVVCQFFASFEVILGIETQTNLPTPTANALNLIMNEIVPHYQKAMKIYKNGELESIIVQRLKQNSKEMLESILLKGENPVVTDMYREKELNWATEPRKLNYYSVKQDEISPLHLEETNDIRDFIQSSFFVRDGLLSLQPKGWKLENDLKESLSIRTFSTFAKQIILVVDSKDISVIGLDIYG